MILFLKISSNHMNIWLIHHDDSFYNFDYRQFGWNFSESKWINDCPWGDRDAVRSESKDTRGRPLLYCRVSPAQTYRGWVYHLPPFHRAKLSGSRSGLRTFVPCKHSIWIAIRIIMIQILGWLLCSNDWTMNNTDVLWFKEQWISHVNGYIF